MPELSVVIPAKDAAATLPATLRALERERAEHDIEVVLVDDSSRDETAALAAGSPAVDRVVAATGAGPAAARNQGAAATSAAAIAFLDADCVPAPGWAAAGLGALAGAELVQGHVSPDPAAPLGPFDRTLWVTGPSPLYESANLFLRRELFERLGGFESWLGAETGKELAEDVWLGWRARRAGARAAFAPAALAHHAVFRRGLPGFVAERRRLRYFPAIAKRVPELRRELFVHRVFLTRRSAAFDLALVAVVAAAVIGSALPLIGVVPYVAASAADSARWGPARIPATALGLLAADAVGFASLAAGSVRARSLVI
jgi:glycosyltransferase involved in cell wall biosynthesis